MRPPRLKRPSLPGRAFQAVSAALAGLLLLVALPGAASATILYGPADTGLVAPDHFTSFEGSALAAGAAIAAEFVADGFTFSGGLRFAPCPGWPNTAGGWTPSGYAATTGPAACAANATDDTFSILFSAVASAASFTAHSHVLPGGLLRLEVLKDGLVQESLDITEANETWCCLPQYVRIEGLSFDEIRVVETAPATFSWIALDNLAFNEATAVPAPGVLAVLRARVSRPRHRAAPPCGLNGRARERRAIARRAPRAGLRAARGCRPA